MQGISGGILAKNKEIKKKQCYQAQVQLPTAQESNAKRQMLAKEKIALLRKLANLGTRWTHVMRPTPEILSAKTVFKRKNVRESGEWGRVSVNRQGKRLGSPSFSMVCRVAGLFRCYLAWVICLQDC